MQIIQNTDEKNHFNYFSEKISQSLSVIIASPYLAADMKDFLNEFDFSYVQHITLITTFKPRDIEQYTKPFQLKDFFEFFQNTCPTCQVVLHINNDLHGKVYCSEQTAIITSANFTYNGFIKNHEFGTMIIDHKYVQEIKEKLLNIDNFDYQDLSYNQIKKSVMFAEAEQKLNPLQDQVKIGTDILSKVATDTDINNTEPQYFLKPYGDSKSPLLLENKEDFSALNQNLHFSKKRPKGLKKGDIVIMFGVGSCALVSYYKVLSGIEVEPYSEQQKDLNKERWPHFVEARNQSPQFGAKWYEYNLDRRYLVKEFHDKFLNIPLTAKGSDDLGTLNYGNDKVLITKEFGEFLIEKINKSVS